MTRKALTFLDVTDYRLPTTDHLFKAVHIPESMLFTQSYIRITKAFSLQGVDRAMNYHL